MVNPFVNMKRFVLKTLVTFILPLVLLLVGVECLFRSYNNDYKQKHAWVQVSAPTVKVLSLGSSHGHYGINPAYFDLPGFNLALPSQSLKYDHFLFFKWAPQCPHLQYVILPIAYFSFFYDIEDGNTWGYAKGYRLYMDCPYHPYEPIYNLELISKEKWLGILKNKGPIVNYVTCDSLGWGYKREYQLHKPHWQQQVMVTLQQHTKSSNKHLSANIQYVEEILTWCQNRNIQVLLLTPPAHALYYTHLDSTQWNTTQGICQQLAQQFKGVTYLNWLKDSTFVEEDFYDADHLNSIGAAKLSKKLNKQITQSPTHQITASP